MIDGRLKVLFCGEEFPVVAGRQLKIGRCGDVEIDDNPHLHRTFLAILEQGGLWWLSNVGSTLTATVADDTGLLQAWLAPGARVPLALSRTLVWVTARALCQLNVDNQWWTRTREGWVDNSDLTIGSQTLSGLGKCEDYHIERAHAAAG